MSAMETLKKTIEKMADTIRTLTEDETVKYKFTDFPKVIEEQLVSKQKAINAINATKTVPNGYVCTEKGMVIGNVKVSVTNHDNSWDADIKYGIYKNGKAMKTGGFSCGAFDKGSGSISTSFTVEKGDRISYSGDADCDAYIAISVTGSLSYTPNPF